MGPQKTSVTTKIQKKKALRSNHLSTANHMQNLHSHLKCAVTLGSANPVYVHDNTHLHGRTKITKSLWQMLVIRKHQKAWYLTIYTIFLWYVSRQPIWKGHACRRERENDAETLSCRETVRVYAVLSSSLFTICLLKPPVSPWSSWHNKRLLRRSPCSFQSQP